MNYSEKLYKICRILDKYKDTHKRSEWVGRYGREEFEDEIKGGFRDLTFVDIARKILNAIN